MSPLTKDCGRLLCNAIDKNAISSSSSKSAAGEADRDVIALEFGNPSTRIGFGTRANY